VLSAFAFSTAGFFTRLIDTDVWTMLFWRACSRLFIAATSSGESAPDRSWPSAHRPPGLVAAGCSTAATICFVNALRETTVADVL